MHQSGAFRLRRLIVTGVAAFSKSHLRKLMKHNVEGEQIVPLNETQIPINRKT
jgi:hypothetical protein